MSAGEWHSRFRKDRDINPAIPEGSYGDIVDRAVAEALRKLSWELSKLHKGCHITQHGLRAECWGPEIADPVFGPRHAEPNQFIPVYTRHNVANTVWLPDARTCKGEAVEVKDVDGSAATRNITIRTVAEILPSGTPRLQTIDGATSVAISSNYGNYLIRSDGQNWFVISNVATVTVPTAASTTEVLTGTDTTKFGTPDSIAALWEKGGDLASATTVTFTEGGYVTITGTVTITGLVFSPDKAGRKIWVRFSDALILTHNATSLILPTDANITTAADDTALFVSEGTNVRCLAYYRNDGTALAGGASTAVTAASVFAAANRVIVADGNDRTADDSDFTMTQDASYVLAPAAGSAMTVLTDPTHTLNVTGKLTSAAHTTTVSAVGTAVSLEGQDATTGPWEKKIPFELTTDGTTGLQTIIDIAEIANSAVTITYEASAARSDAARHDCVAGWASFSHDGATLALMADTQPHNTASGSCDAIAWVASGTNMRLQVTPGTANVFRIRGFARVSHGTSGA